MSDIVLVFPNSLFENNELITSSSTVYLIEHSVYFCLYPYHKMKLVLHRASMKYYQNYLEKKYKCIVKYITYSDDLSKKLSKHKNQTVHFYDPTDHLVMSDLRKISRQHHLQLEIYETPLFMTPSTVLKKYIADKNSITHGNFYRFQRIHHNVLLTQNGKPKGGKWSFDTENQKPFPKNFNNNFKPKPKSNKYIIEAKKYVNKHFKNNPGSDNIYFPIDYGSAKRWFQKFVKERLNCFGPYQDAQSDKIPFGCHSIISPMLNIGLLTPEYVVRTAEKSGKKIESVEGFIRQILGWREAIRMIYLFRRSEMEKKKNYFKHYRKLNNDLWLYYSNNTTGFYFIDELIEKTINYGYLHHIERLMYVGNFMLLAKINPKEVFRWFMTMFVDSYQWVMYGNVYAMSQYSTGRLLMTRPYFSSSNYLLKMSNIKKNADICLDHEYPWTEVWNALYYRFISENKKDLGKNYAVARQVKYWNNKSKSEQNNLISLANRYDKLY